MAKTKKKGTFSFTDLGDHIEQIAKSNNLNIKVERESDFDEVVDHISTGNYLLNGCISGQILGGFPAQGIHMIGGDEGTGKTFLCLNIAREAQKLGYKVMYIDTEYAIKNYQIRERAAKLGLDISTEEFMLIRNNIIEEIKMILSKMLDDLKKKEAEGYEIPKFVIFLDSIGKLASKKEIDDAIKMDIKSDMTRAKAGKSLMRIITNDLGVLKIPMFMTNHVYEEQGMFPKTIFGGGKGFRYASDTIILLKKAKDRDSKADGDDLDIGYGGIVVTATIEKNRTIIPKKVKFKINFQSAMNPYEGLEFFCKAENFGKVGIFRGKYTVDKSTGEEKIEEKKSGPRWYIRHLDEHVYTKNLHNEKVFTPEVLEELNNIAHDYFEYNAKPIPKNEDESNDEGEDFSSDDLGDIIDGI